MQFSLFSYIFLALFVHQTLQSDHTQKFMSVSDRSGADGTNWGQNYCQRTSRAKRRCWHDDRIIEPCESTAQAEKSRAIQYFRRDFIRESPAESLVLNHL